MAELILVRKTRTKICFCHSGEPMIKQMASYNNANKLYYGQKQRKVKKKY